MKQHSIPGFAILLIILIAGCSKSPTIEGEWANENGSTMEFKQDGAVVLGQEETEMNNEGTYHWSGDTLIVSSTPDTPEGMYNSFTFLQAGDSLHLLEMRLHREGQEAAISGHELAARLGKETSELAFVRTSGEKE
ncbi:MAG: hypothetical protein CL946_13820 [Ectothiorhodospiraceae bacterium]|nr:hypothetical protein [Ectothiorhodospiraceae bacterium]